MFKTMYHDYHKITVETQLNDMLCNCRKVLDIVWEKRPKWLNDERLYNLATSALPNDRKCAILDALTNHNEREVNALRIPKSKSYTK